MLYLTLQGKEDIEKSYPIDISFKHAIMITICQYIYCYAIMAISMFVVYGSEMREPQVCFYYINLCSMFLTIYIVLNSFLTGITTSKCTGKNRGSFKAVLMRGKYKFGLFTRGSVLRHVITNPVVDGLIYTLIIVTNKFFTEMPNGDINFKQVLVILGITIATEMLFGAVRVLFINNGKALSRELVVGLECARSAEIDPIDHNKEMPQEEEVDVIDEGPYYRTFIV